MGLRACLWLPIHAALAFHHLLLTPPDPSPSHPHTIHLAPPQKHGFHLIITPHESAIAECLPCDVVVMSVGRIRACLGLSGAAEEPQGLATAAAAMQCVMAHELAHLYLKHEVSAPRWQRPCHFAVRVVMAGVTHIST